MDYEAAYPYVNEAIDLWAVCAQRLEAVEAASRRWLDADVSSPADDGLGVLRFMRRLPHEQTMLSDIEALLAAYARISLLLYPVAASAKSRGTELRKLLRLPDEGPLGNRDLRDSWMHFDERLDAAVAGGRYGRSEWFARSQDVTEDLKQRSVRLIVVDTLHVYYWTRGDTIACEHLPSLREPLNSLFTSVRDAENIFTAPKVRSASSNTA